MTTIAQLLKLADTLDSDTPLLDAQVLLAHVLGKSRTWLYTWPEREVPEELAAAYLGLLERRRDGEPIAYLTGSQEFWSLTLEVSPATLIPRPDTELLVELALSLDLPGDARVLDLGTGTGAIALALASERPDWRVKGVDISAEAVALARRNAEGHNLGRVEFFASHWLAAVTGTYDLIVSNPPYIAADDPHLALGGVRFEPRSALVAGEDGAHDLRQIVAAATGHLRPGGWLLVEHGADQGALVRDLFLAAGYGQVASHRDLAGLERVTLGSAPLTCAGEG